MGYPNLPLINDPHLAKALKVISDRINKLTGQQQANADVIPPFNNDVDLVFQRLVDIGTPIDLSDGVSYGYARSQIIEAVEKANLDVLRTGRVGPGNGIIPAPAPPPPKPQPGHPPLPPPTGPPNPGGPNPYPCHTDISKGQPGGIPNSLRWFKGNFCGIRVPGIESIPGGAGDASLVFTPFLDRYSPDSQSAILSSYRNHGYSHFKLSWPDSRDGNGQSVAQFIGTVGRVQAAGLNPVVFLSAKGYDDPGNFPGAVNPIIGPLKAAGVQLFCVGWELSLWMSPQQCQNAIDYCVSQGLTEASGHLLYVHFQVGYPSFQFNGERTAAFWQRNVGKLTGLLYQADPSDSCADLQTGNPTTGKSGLIDIQLRCAGGAFWPTDTGFGHPVDCVADELTAMTQFFGGLSEGGGDQQGFYAICSPGPVAISGSNNGFHT